MNAKQLTHRLKDLNYSVREDEENGIITVKVLGASGKVFGRRFSVEELCLHVNPVLVVVRMMNQTVINNV